MTATVGGIVGQEIIKACTGKFSPIKQFLYFHAINALPSETKPSTANKPRNSRYDDYYAVFGDKVQNHIFNLKMFLIGSGAIGCEMLKNWAMMGLSTGESSLLIPKPIPEFSHNFVIEKFMRGCSEEEDTCDLIGEFSLGIQNYSIRQGW
eukprot:1256997-Amorphochlora_amoeboformis.AAC.1